ncbi:MAG: phosphoglycerate kinase [Verrucomicrobia subdivision 6 bacterium BACL9 MAG-120924-bin69]|uniref:Phosphoglycerate kinase n=2 Tax=Verrucomicrobia subdivision 6 TaxID=134627 RepID=A0A0R2RHA2_9BACT|nr:MAG: phosphoglycerate kinase [Verrucomicrobia subdivision 6 bacterium BACL9 MAG-120507-bin52]KRP34257.1 MAG: phosphoglycerate kinase [Verrucomicrobia subdivision 6 bacterium BACL9 MAG-120924-bin69]HCP06592.1 phosphoglycerate kinase [Verrucomicrobiales bacterium]
MPKLTVQALNPKGQPVFVRVDFNVPLEPSPEGPRISDDTRIQETLPTLQLLLEKGASLILASHLGRPKGKPEEKYSLRPIAAYLAKKLHRPVHFASDCVGPEADQARASLKPGEILLLENVRFHAEEEKNDPAFAQKLLGTAKIYVNDAFGSAHRAHASTEGCARLATQAAAGLLMEKELRYLGSELSQPKPPFLVILGGAKVGDKIGVLRALLEKANTILIGGGMSYTFRLAQGRKIGRSLCEPDKVELAKSILAEAEKRGVRLLLPEDTLIVEKLDFAGRTVSPGKFTQPGADIPDGWEGVDIGPQARATYAQEISTASTILWNGPMGVFEIPACAEGTFAIAQAVAANQKAVSIIGGGDSVKAVKKAGVANQVTFISTGGGASLEFLEGKNLPGVAALQDLP